MGCAVALIFGAPPSAGAACGTGASDCDLRQRYTLVIMNGLGGEGDCDGGVATTTQLSRILLAP